MNVETSHGVNSIEAKNPYVVADDVVYIVMSDGTFAAVDESDFPRVAQLRWFANGEGYAQARIRFEGKVVYTPSSFFAGRPG